LEGCSWRRFGQANTDKPFIYPYVASDGVSDINISTYNSDFIIQSANARTAIKAMYEENQRLRKIVDKFSSPASPIGDSVKPTLKGEADE